MKYKPINNKEYKERFKNSFGYYIFKSMNLKKPTIVTVFFYLILITSIIVLSKTFFS